MNNADWLKDFPLAFFSMTMGLTGLCLAWEKTSQTMGLKLPINLLLAGVALVVFMVLAALLMLKIVRHPDALVTDLNHPVKLNFLATIPISLLLLATATLHLRHTLSLVLWLTGASLQLAALLYIMNTWIHKQHFKLEHLNPAWFIPAAGNVVVPLAGVAHGYAEVAWFFFSVGMLFWLVLLSIIFNRILFHTLLPEKLLPTLFILIAPPSVGFVAYLKLTGNFDVFAHMLYHIGLFFTLLLLTQFSRFTRLPFFLSSWAYTFPLAAVTVSIWYMFEINGSSFLKVVAMGLLALLSLVVLVLPGRTWQPVRAGQICVPG